MNVQFDMKHGVCVIVREPGERALKSESAFYYKVKEELRKQGHDVIKKLIQKDGHLWGDQYTYYLRERKWKWALVDGMYAIRQIHQEFNKTGKTTLQTGWKDE